jgi:hypothetical protein
LPCFNNIRNDHINIIAGLFFETLLVFQLIAAKDLRVESMRVYIRLKAGDIEGVRPERIFLPKAG